MFYAHFVLSKKGPLAKVWLAAHWERKLTKTHVYETNIEETVDSLLNPKVKLALRTSGHLLLGVVRIHSRKARYLLQDCNEALTKIKQAFRPVCIDLPPEQRVATKAAITMPVEKEVPFAPREFAMVEIDFDLDMEDLSDAVLRQQFASNQCRPEDITLNENIVGMNQIERDDALIDDFGEGDLNIPDFNLGDDILDIPRMSVDRHLNVEQENAREKADDVNGFEPEPVEMPGFDNFGDEPVAVVPITDAAVPEPANGEQPHPEPEGNKDDTTLILPEQGFTLAPRETIIPAKERVRAKRRRKLIIDEQKVISSDQMRLQLQDPSDIIKPLEIAPATEKLMYMQELANMDKLWNHPGVYFDDGVIGLNSKLADFFAERVAHAVVPQKYDRSQDFFPDTLDLSVDQYSRNFQEAMRHSTMLSGEELPIPMGAEEYPPLEDYIHEIRSPRERHKRTRDDASPDAQVPPATPRPKRGRGLNEEGSEEGADEEAHPEDHDRMSRRTKEVFDQFTTLLVRRHSTRRSNPDGSQSVNFEDLIRGKRSRKEVAQRFYSTLVLKKLQAVDVEQENAYGEIWLKKGSRFVEFSA